jgi:cob(I)alamin adenosyltransferase
MSKYLAYTFLYDDAGDLKCDFELLTDEIASMIGVLRSLLNEKDQAADPDLTDNLSRLNELMYHLNPSLRTQVTVTEEELAWLSEQTLRLKRELREGPFQEQKPLFVLPQGCTQAAYSHVVRSKCKILVRLLSRYQQQGNQVDEILFDFTNLYAGYFYYLTLWLNKNQGVQERPFISRVYK